MAKITRRKMNQLLALMASSYLQAPSILAGAPAKVEEEFFRIAFSSWSFHMPLWKGELKAIGLPQIARKMGVDSIEWTAKTFRDLSAGRDVMFKAPPPAFFRELRKAGDDVGVLSKVMNVGGPFYLGSSARAERQKALDFILQYVDPARVLGCEILSTQLYVNQRHRPGWQEEAKLRSMEAILSLLEATRDTGLIINVENHHGISSDPKWLTDLVKSVGSPRFKLTVDTNNFRLDLDDPYNANSSSFPRYVDRYLGIETLMPFASWVSAKFYKFDSTGYEVSMDYPRIIDIIRSSQYSGYISVEYEGDGDALDGVYRSVKMLSKVREHILDFPRSNGRPNSVELRRPVDRDPI